MDAAAGPEDTDGDVEPALAVSRAAMRSARCLLCCRTASWAG